MLWRAADTGAEELGFDSDESLVSTEIPESEAGFDSASADLPRARTTVEGVMGLLAAFFIGLPSPFVAAAAVAHLPLKVPTVLPILALLTAGYLSAIVVRLASRAIEGDRPRFPSFALMSPPSSPVWDHSDEEVFVPLALAMALRLPKWWAIVRPFVAIWWMSHFVAAAMMGHAAGVWLNGINNQGLIFAIPFTLVVTMAFLFAANLYLMLAIAVCIQQPRIWLIAWRYRIVVDLILAGTLLAAGN